jgi:hypothetical protein
MNAQIRAYTPRHRFDPIKTAPGAPGRSQQSVKRVFNGIGGTV